MVDSNLLISKWLEKNTLPHALLFAGPPGACLAERGYELACRAILKSCPSAEKKLAAKTHPDVHFFRPEGRTGMHAIEALRKLSQEVSLNCVEASLKFLIVEEAERCLPTSHNALLKTLEEPVSHSILILLTSKPERLLPTIVSRCQRLYFPAKVTRERNEWQKRLVAFLAGECEKSEIDAMVKEMEKGRKEWEKKMIKELPQEATPLQKERWEKEIEAASTLEFQEKAFSLFESFLLWSRDVAFFHLGAPPSLLAHHDKHHALKKSPPLPLARVEKSLRRLKIAIERQTSLQVCLDALLIEFGYA